MSIQVKSKAKPSKKDIFSKIKAILFTNCQFNELLVPNHAKVSKIYFRTSQAEICSSNIRKLEKFLPCNSKNINNLKIIELFSDW